MKTWKVLVFILATSQIAQGVWNWRNYQLSDLHFGLGCALWAIGWLMMRESR